MEQKTEMKDYIIHRPEDRDGWLELRKSGIGSSEAGVLMGVSRFDTPAGLYAKKTGLRGPEEENEAMRQGHIQEPGIAAIHQALTGDVMDPASAGDWIAQDREKPHLRVSPDRIFWDKGIPSGERTYDNAYILECKTTRLQVTEEDYPKSWYCQVQYQMGVMRLRRAVIAWLSYGTGRYGETEVRFNPAFYGTLTSVIDDFWNNHVLRGVPPQEIQASSDIDIVFPEADAGKSVKADGRLAVLVDERKSRKARMAEDEGRIKEIDSEVRTALADAAYLRDGDGKVLVSFLNTKRHELDLARFMTERPDEYRGCLVTHEDFDIERMRQTYPELVKQYTNTVQGGRRISYK